MLEKDYKEYQLKVNEEGKKPVQLMNSQPLSPEKTKDQFKKNKELAIQMRMKRLST
jgi:hypothetical protein